MRYFFTLILAILCFSSFCQSNWIIDNKTGCKIQDIFQRKFEKYSWSGGCIDSIANGQGTLIWRFLGFTRDKYIGNLKNGIPTGQGKFIYSKNLIYSGEFKNGKLNGPGIKISGKHRYEGEFIDDELNGLGKLFRDNRLEYEGQFTNSVENGAGKMYSSDGSIFQGILENGYYKKGKLTDVNGDILDGEWDDFELINGTYKYHDGRLYEGQMKDWRPNGLGKMIYSDGTIENGIWKKGKLIK